MDRISSRTSEEILIQTVTCRVKPESARLVKFIPSAEIDRLYDEARIVVCHAGTGTLLSSLRHGKKPIIVPRMKEFGELFDDHQADFCDAIESEYGFTIVRDIETLESVVFSEDIEEKTRLSEWKSLQRAELTRQIRRYLEEAMRDERQAVKT